jgi:phosphatidylserine/phosphatidylglycerophosphate/cardiolipin synthase-like enzyme
MRSRRFWTLTLGAGLLAGAFAAGVLATGRGFAALSATAGPEIHYAPEEDLESFDVGLLNEAGETVDMAAYVLTDVPVIEALTDAAQRGVAVRIYRFPDEHAPSERAGEALAKLAASGAERFKKGADLMHLKSYCVDGRTLRSGAANFSWSGLRRQDNDLVILRGPDACRGFKTAFEAMWREVR